MTNSELLNVKQLVLKDDLKRMLIYWQLFKVNLECIRTSDTLKEWSQEAKKNKNKDFVDLRILAADHIRAMDAMILKMKKTLRPNTWNAIMSTLTGEQVKEIDLLMNEITELKEDVITNITEEVKEAKRKADIPLNNEEHENNQTKD